MEKFLFYENLTTDMVCIPAHRLVEMIIDDNSDLVSLHHRVYDNGTDGSDMQYAARLTVTAGKAKQVVETISNNISTGKDAFIVVADDVNGEYIDSNITGLASLTDIS